MLIPIIYEPHYNKDSIWCARIREGIEKSLAQKKYSSVFIDGESYRDFDFETLFCDEPRLLILVANRCSWIMSALEFFHQNNINIVLVDCCTLINDSVKGQVYFHYEKGIETILNYLSECGCGKTALYGLFRNSFADSIKQKSFEKNMMERGITDVSALCFENNDGLANCYNRFFERVTEFDSVICTNEIAANSLIKRLKADRIRVPKDLQVVCYGFTKLTNISTPSLTTLKFDNDAIGQQAIAAFRYLYNANNDSTHLTIRVSGELVERESTQKPSDTVTVTKLAAQHTDTSSLNFYDDEEVLAFSKIEKLLLACDTIDIQIIQRILKNAPYERISDELHLSRGTVFYRIKRMEDAVDIQSLNEFKEFLLSHHFEDIFDNYIDE